MRYAVIRGYRMAGPLHDYAFGEFSHETPKKIATKDSVHYRKLHDKSDLVCLCETREQAERICGWLMRAKEKYLERVRAADKAYIKSVTELVAFARGQAELLSTEVDQAISVRPQHQPRRARGFHPKVVGGTECP